MIFFITSELIDQTTGIIVDNARSDEVRHPAFCEISSGSTLIAIIIIFRQRMHGSRKFHKGGGGGGGGGGGLVGGPGPSNRKKL